MSSLAHPRGCIDTNCRFVGLSLLSRRLLYYLWIHDFLQRLSRGSRPLGLINAKAVIYGGEALEERFKEIDVRLHIIGTGLSCTTSSVALEKAKLGITYRFADGMHGQHRHADVYNAYTHFAEEGSNSGAARPACGMALSNSHALKRNALTCRSELQTPARCLPYAPPACE